MNIIYKISPYREALNTFHLARQKTLKKSGSVLADVEVCFSELVYGNTGMFVQVTAAPARVSIEFKAQFWLVDSPLPTFFCFISCSVFVSDSSPPSNAYTFIGVEESIPVNVAAVKTATRTNDLFISNLLTDYPYI
jgi:hypothetical protein